MKIYIAARYDRRIELLELKAMLEDRGHTVTSTWLSGIGETWTREECATCDIYDIAIADVLISIAENPNSGTYNSGGRHVELGYALAVNKRCIIVGHRENVFHHLPHIEFYESIEEMIAKI